LLGRTRTEAEMTSSLSFMHEGVFLAGPGEPNVLHSQVKECMRIVREPRDESSVKVDEAVRGHPSVSLLPLSSPTLPLSIGIPHPHLCTILKDHTYSRRLSRSRLTNSCRLSTSHSTCTSAALDKPQTHWDRSMWHYGTLHYHADTQLWEAWYCNPLYILCRLT
jgi:hypothetical protein